MARGKTGRKKKESNKYISLQFSRQTPLISPDKAGYTGHGCCLCVSMFVACKNPLIGGVLKGKERKKEWEVVSKNSRNFDLASNQP